MTAKKLPSVTAAEAAALGAKMHGNVRDVMNCAAAAPSARIAAAMGYIGGINTIGSVVAQAIAKKPELTGPQIVALIMAYQARAASTLAGKLEALDLAMSGPVGHA